VAARHGIDVHAWVDHTMLTADKPTGRICASERTDRQGPPSAGSSAAAAVRGTQAMPTGNRTSVTPPSPSPAERSSFNVRSSALAPRRRRCHIVGPRSRPSGRGAFLSGWRATPARWRGAWPPRDEGWPLVPWVPGNTHICVLAPDLDDPRPSRSSLRSAAARAAADRDRRGRWRT
jgi:hypothetical protein